MRPRTERWPRTCAHGSRPTGTRSSSTRTRTAASSSATLEGAALPRAGPRRRGRVPRDQDYIDSKWCTAELAVAVSRGCLISPAYRQRRRPPAGGRAPAHERTPRGRSQSGADQAAQARRERPAAVAGRREPLSRSRAVLRGTERSVLRTVPGDPGARRTRPAGGGPDRHRRGGPIGLREVVADAGRPAPGDGDRSGLDRPAHLGPRRRPDASIGESVAEAARGVGLAWTVGEVRTRLDEERGLRDLVDEVGVATPGRRDRQVLLPIDQAEELFASA